MKQQDVGIAKLRELTERLGSFGLSGQSNGFVEVEMDGGTSFGFNLMNKPEIAVADWYNSKDSDFPEHDHNEREWLICYSGEMHLTVNGEKIVLKPGEYVYNPPRTPHSCYCPVDSKYLAITIPASEKWPK